MFIVVIKINNNFKNLLIAQKLFLDKEEYSCLILLLCHYILALHKILNVYI